MQHMQTKSSPVDDASRLKARASRASMGRALATTGSVLRASPAPSTKVEQSAPKERGRYQSTRQSVTHERDTALESLQRDMDIKLQAEKGKREAAETMLAQLNEELASMRKKLEQKDKQAPFVISEERVEEVIERHATKQTQPAEPQVSATSPSLSPPVTPIVLTCPSVVSTTSVAAPVVMSPVVVSRLATSPPVLGTHTRSASLSPTPSMSRTRMLVGSPIVSLPQQNVGIVAAAGQLPLAFSSRASVAVAQPRRSASASPSVEHMGAPTGPTTTTTQTQRTVKVTRNIAYPGGCSGASGGGAGSMLPIEGMPSANCVEAPS